MGKITAKATATTPSQTITSSIGSRITDTFFVVISAFTSNFCPILRSVSGSAPERSPATISCWIDTGMRRCARLNVLKLFYAYIFNKLIFKFYVYFIKRLFWYCTWRVHHWIASVTCFRKSNHFTNIFFTS